MDPDDRPACADAPATVLYHYTCHHARYKLGDRGKLLAPRELGNVHGGRLFMQGIFAELDSFTWLTDLDYPYRDALGLSSDFADCDRTRYRYRVLDRVAATPWAVVRRSVNPQMVAVLESTPAVMPMHWWVTSQPVEVALDPIAVRS